MKKFHSTMMALLFFGLFVLGQTANAQRGNNSVHPTSTLDMLGFSNKAKAVASKANTVNTPSLVGNVYYIRWSGGENWGSSDNTTALTAVFGAFTTTDFVAAVPATIFSPATGFVFMEGGNAGATELNTFLTANIVQIENWVAAGGRLYIKAAPNVGGNINLGFGGVVLNFNNLTTFSTTATATIPGHPIFVGPYTPVVLNYTGNFYAHAILTGGTFTNIMNGNSPGCVLGGQSWGSGFVMFSTGTLVGSPGQEPAADAQNLLQNILSYVGNVVIICTPPAITCPANITVNNDPGLCSAVVNYSLPTATDNCGTNPTFNYTGSMQTWTVPEGVTSIHVEAFGAQGGNNKPLNTIFNFQLGGKGGKVEGDISVVPGTVLNIFVGGTSANETGGFNGGGNGSLGVGGGGGATDIRIGGTDLFNRILVAGGGGAGGQSVAIDPISYGHGGGLIGMNGSITPNGIVFATGGTQFSGGNGGKYSFELCLPGVQCQDGSLGVGGDGYTGPGQDCSAIGGTGGGGGYFGGGGMQVNTAGGGSSYTEPIIVTSVTHTQGSQTGDGQLIITYLVEPIITQTSGLPSGSTFPVGITTNTFMATDASGNTATCSFTIEVIDNEPPVISPTATDLTVECDGAGNTAELNAWLASNGGASATDQCGGVTWSNNFTALSDDCGNTGSATVIFTATDASGNTATTSATFTIEDTQPPVIPETFVNKTALWPPNHKMVDITLSASDICSTLLTGSVTVTSNEPINDIGDGNTDPDWIIVDGFNIQLRAERSGVKALVTPDIGRIYTINWVVTDDCGNTSSATNTVTVAHNITAPNTGNSFKIGTTVSLAGTFWDVPGKKHTAKWVIDGTTVNGTVVSEPSGTKVGKVTGSYKPTVAGVYKLRMNITDQNGNTSYATSNGDNEAFLVAYNAKGGYAFGGGKFSSPLGALKSKPNQTGKVAYGFASNYFKNATNPKGETEFDFKIGDFEFTALNYDYLVISGAKAQFKGTGKTIINGVEQGGIAFIMTVIDGQAAGGGGVDKIRMKIYNKNSGSVIYDNQMGASDAADPTMAADDPTKKENIVVVNTTAASEVNTSSAIAQMEVIAGNAKFNVRALPNPSAHQFSLYIEGNSNEKVQVRLYDALGRKVTQIEKSGAQVIRFGEKLGAGVYIAEVTQGTNRKTIKLVKQ